VIRSKLRILERRHLAHQDGVLEFIIGPVGKLVHSEGGQALVLGITLVDTMHVLLEDSKTAIELIFGLVDLVVRVLEFDELVDDALRSSEDYTQKEEDKDYFHCDGD